MGFDDSFNKNYLSKVPYLDGADKSSYEQDLNAILNNDINSSDIYTYTQNLNNAFDGYLNTRNTGDIGNDNLLDSQLLTAYKSNNEMIKQLTQHKIEKYRQLHNIEEHLKNFIPQRVDLIFFFLAGAGQNRAHPRKVT